MSDLPGTMPAAVYRQAGDVVVEERPVPSPGPGQVLVEVDHCGICGSDIHLMLDGWGAPDTIFGHEFSGVVAEVGEGVADWAIGDLIVGGPSPRCGTCRRCLEGKPSQCENRTAGITEHTDGAFARYVVVPDRSLLRVPDGLTSREAALAEPLAVALHGITRAGLQPEDTIMVFGAGPIGALTLATLATMDVGPVTVVEPSAERQVLAKRLGATQVLDPSELEVYERWEPERISPHAVHVVLECSGKKPAVETAFCQLRRGGTLVLVGAGNQILELDPNRMILNELSMCGSFVYDEHGFEHALELLASGKLPTDVLIDGHDVGLDAIGDTLGRLARGDIAGKAMVVPRLTETLVAQ